MVRILSHSASVLGARTRKECKNEMETSLRGGDEDGW